MKVLTANKFYYLKGGSETYYFSLNNLLKEKGFEVIPFSMKDSKNFKSEFEDYFIENIDFSNASFVKKLNYSGKIIYSFEAYHKILKLAKNTKPDIAHLHIFQHQMSPSIVKALKKQGIPVVNTVHDLKPLCPNYKMLNSQGVCERCKKHKYINCFKYKCSKNSMFGSLVNTVEMYLHHLLGSYKDIDMYITPSRFYRNKFIEFGYDPQKVTYIPNFIDVKEYVPNYSSQNYFLFFGRLSEEKGIMSLLKAMENIKGIELYVAGDGPLKEEVENTIERKHLNAKYLGFRTGQDLIDLIKNSKFTILPSEWYENSPLSVIESMAYGKPVLGSDIGGIPEMIEDMNTGMVFKPGNVEDLTRKVNYLMDHPEKVEEMGKAARLKVEKEFNKELHVERVLNVYNRFVH